MASSKKKIVETFRNENLSQFIEALTGEDIKNFLIEVNRQVRELNSEEGRLYKGDRMIVGECISPKGAIQEKYFDKMVEFLKCINSREDMAIGMYYLINYLHLFQDGNGRTSRFVYETIANSNFEDYNGKFFRHEQGKETSRAGFCDLKGIKEITDAKKYSGYAIYKYLMSMDLLPEELRRGNLYCARTYIPSPDNEGVYISEKALDDGILSSEVRLS